MVCFGIEIKNARARGRFLEIKGRLASDNLVKNPFLARIRENNKGFFLVSIKPVWPPVWAYGVIFGGFGSILAWGFWAWLFFAVFCAALFLSLWWWFAPLYFLFFYLGMRGGVKYVSPGKCLERVV